MKQELTMVWHGAIMGSDILFKNISLLLIIKLNIYLFTDLLFTYLLFTVTVTVTLLISFHELHAMPCQHACRMP